MKSGRMFFTAAALFAALALGACGGGDDTTSDTTEATSSSEGTSGSTASSGGAATETDFKGSSNSDFCKYAQQVEKDGSFGDSFMTGTDAKSMKDDLKKAQDVYGTAVSKASSEIKGDMQTMQKALKSYSDLLSQYDFDMTKLTAAVAKDPSIATKLAAFDSADFTASAERVDAYFTKVCGIDVG